MQCKRVSVAAEVITTSLAEILPTMLEIRAALMVSLFLTEAFLADPNSKGVDQRLKVEQIVLKELGILN